jgi:hypothetical protein
VRNPVFVVEGGVSELELIVFSFTSADFGLGAAGGGSSKISKTALMFPGSISRQK